VSALGTFPGELIRVGKVRSGESSRQGHRVLEPTRLTLSGHAANCLAHSITSSARASSAGSPPSSQPIEPDAGSR
jgi:hypothetical protein